MTLQEIIQRSWHVEVSHKCSLLSSTANVSCVTLSPQNPSWRSQFFINPLTASTQEEHVGYQASNFLFPFMLPHFSILTKKKCLPFQGPYVNAQDKMSTTWWKHSVVKQGIRQVTFKKSKNPARSLGPSQLHVSTISWAHHHTLLLGLQRWQ